MSDLLTHIRRLEMVDVDLDKEPQCESIHHTEDMLSHAGPAAFWQVGHCVHGTGLRCARKVATLRQFDTAICRVCGVHGPVSEIRFVEL